MHKFDDEKGVRRLVDITNMETSDVENYYLQFFSMKPVEKEAAERKLKEEIKGLKATEKKYKWILAIKSKTGKVVGKIEVFELVENKMAYVTIEIPNKNWVHRYGKEAIHEFIKICKENNYFSTIELEARNGIVEQYIRSVPENKKEDYIIKIA